MSKSIRAYVAIAFVGLAVAVASLSAAVVSRTNQASAASAPSLYVDPSTQTVSPGATFTVTVRQLMDVQTQGAQADIDFNPSQLQVDSVARGSVYSTASLFMGISPNTGAAAITAANTTGVLENVAVGFTTVGSTAPAGDQPAFVITMHALPGASGATSIDLTNFEVTTADGNHTIPGVVSVSGTVTVNNPSAPTITNTPTSTPTETPTPSLTPTATQTLTGSETATDTPTQTGTPTATAATTSTGTPTSTATAAGTSTSTATPVGTSTGTATATATATASLTGQIFVVPPSTTAPYNTDITILINQTANFITAGTQTDITFDKSLLQIESVTKAPAYNGGALIAGIAPQQVADAIAEANTTGTLKNVSAYFVPGTGQLNAGENSFITVKMKTGSSDGTSPITLTEMEMIDLQGNSVSIQGTNGQVVVQKDAPTPVAPTPAVAGGGSTGSSGGTNSVLGTSRGSTGGTARGLPGTGGGILGSHASVFVLTTIVAALTALSAAGLAAREWWKERRHLR